MPGIDPSGVQSDFDTNAVHVAVGIIFDEHKKILISRRPAHKDFSNCWEFPGGKLHQGEGVEQALRRELKEELGLEVVTARPLIKIRHRYEHVSVVLDTWRVESYRGTASGCEGQAIAWASVEQLDAEHFPPADVAIFQALRLPSCYSVTPQISSSGFWQRFEALLSSADIELICLRDKEIAAADYRHACERALSMCQSHGVKLMLHGRVQLLQSVPAHGVHLSSKQLNQHQARPISTDLCLAASCHNLHELKTAERMNVDFAVLSPVKVPHSHSSDLVSLGWEEFQDLVEQVNFPVYALGGMLRTDVAQAHRCGGQGIAAISAFWD